MIFLDANYFLRLMTEPHSVDQKEMMTASAQLMRSVASGSRTATTSDAILGEVVHVLAGPLYGANRSRIGEGLLRFIHLRGFVSPSKSIWTEALQIWMNQPGLSFVDSLAASYSLSEGYDLATFDRKLARYPGLSLYSPEKTR